MDSDFRPQVPSHAVRLPRWPDSPPIALNAWMCDCGDHGFTDSQPASRRELEAHLAGSAHRHGEYYYGRREQRIAIRVIADPDGRFTHTLL